MFCTSGRHDLDGHVTVQIQLPLLTATLVHQHKPGIVVVVGAKIVVAAVPVIEHADTPNVLLVQEGKDGVLSFIGNATQRESYAPSGVKHPPSYDMATHSTSRVLDVIDDVFSLHRHNAVSCRTTSTTRRETFTTTRHRKATNIA